MCGRTACTLCPEDVCKSCSFSSRTQSNYVCPTWKDHPGNYTYSPSTNLAPSMFSPIFLKAKFTQAKRDVDGAQKYNSEYIIQPMMWGLIPTFYKGDSAKSHGFKTNNCRLEDVEEKKSYLPSLKGGQRCVVLSDGFYEWHTTKGTKIKQPYFIHVPQSDDVKIWNNESWNAEESWSETEGWKGVKLLKMAGLYSKWKSNQGEEVYSYTIITMESGGSFASLHHRIPAVLDTQEDVENWLNEADYKVALSKLRNDVSLSWYPVSSRVNNSRNQDVDLMCSVDIEQKPAPCPSSKLMTAWLKTCPERSSSPPVIKMEPKKLKKENSSGLLKWLKKESK